jgi:putative ABC transport system permease protein
MIVNGHNPLVATAVGAISGAVAGATTGVLNTRFGINKLLAGILTMTALYSINLHVMGKSNVPLLSSKSLITMAESAISGVVPRKTISVAGWEVARRDLSSLLFALFCAAVVGLVMYWFFRTNAGSAMRATGDNEQMIRALGVSVENMIIIGLALSNGLVALAGALLAQYQGFADVQMGIGTVVWGLASVIIGEALVASDSLGFTIIGAIMGSVLFRLMVAIALRWGLDPNDLKLITAAFVFVALIVPAFAKRWSVKRRVASYARTA